MGTELELRDMLRSAARILVECSYHSERKELPHDPFHNMFGDEDTNPQYKLVLTESALQEQKEVQKIITYLKEHTCIEEEELKQKEFEKHLTYEI